MKHSGGGLDYRFVPMGVFAALALVAFVFATATLFAASAPAAEPMPTSDPAVAGARIEARPETVVRTWDDQTMRSAAAVGWTAPSEAAFDLPGPGARSSAASGDFMPDNPTGYPQRVHGKLFFKYDAVEYVCSGTVVNSKGRNVVYTAGHCIYDRDTGRYASEMAFVPAYEGAAAEPAPLGIWAASAVFTNSVYVDHGSPSHDIGVVVLAEPVERSTGSRRIAFDLNPAERHFRIYGYPIEPDPPFDGNSLIGCNSQVVDRDSSAGVPSPMAAAPCSMQQGASGGGWVTGGGYLNSVTSYGYCDAIPSLCGRIFGPYFSDQAKSLYTYPAVGGSVTPTFRFRSGPRGPVRGRRTKFTVSGSGSTPIGFRCRLDRGNFVRCGTSIRIRGLSPGRHVLRVKAVDQTGKTSRLVKKTFRVLHSRR